MRTFQFSDSKSHKFWNIDIDSTKLIIQYGKVGTNGQTLEKMFMTEAKAQTEMAKLIREKTGKGYIETTPTVAISDREAFERTIALEPTNVMAWSAYADYLTEQGDPRGEFMQVQLALEDETLKPKSRLELIAREKELLAEYERDWLGALAPWILDAKSNTYYFNNQTVERKPIYHRFERGWLAELNFAEIRVVTARAMRNCPSARFLRELRIYETAYESPSLDAVDTDTEHFHPGPDIPADVQDYDSPSIHALCRFPHFSSIRVLQLGDGVTNHHDKDEDYFNCHMDGEQAFHLIKQMPNLEELYLFAHRVDTGKIASLKMPNLRVFQLYHSTQYPLDKLANNPSLTQLTAILCHPHALEPDGESDDEDGTVHAYIRLKHLRAICRSPYLQNLSILRLRLTDFGDQGAREIVQSGILQRLTVLDLQGGCLSDEGAEIFANCPDLRHLERLNLSRNALTPHGIELLQKTGVSIDVSSQHNERPPFAENAFLEYLYDGDIE
jgi:uncharacterized protein (TIGR02996 family)